MHFLTTAERETYPRTLTKPRAIATAQFTRLGKRGSRSLVVLPGEIGVAKLGTQWAPLPESVVVEGEDGKVIRPSSGLRFYVSMETFDPFHGLLEGTEELFG